MREKRKSQFGKNENYVSAKSMTGYDSNYSYAGYNGT